MSGQIRLAQINTPDKNIQLIQSNIDKALSSLQTTPFQGGNYLTSVAVDTVETVISHGLGRTPQIWVIGDRDTNTTVARTAWDSTTITLQAGSACTISIWVN